MPTGSVLEIQSSVGHSHATFSFPDMPSRDQNSPSKRKWVGEYDFGLQTDRDTTGSHVIFLAAITLLSSTGTVVHYFY